MFGLSLEWIQKLYPGGGAEVPVTGNSLAEDDNEHDHSSIPFLCKC